LPCGAFTRAQPDRLAWGIMLGWLRTNAT
jgi:hypothetical protein